METGFLDASRRCGLASQEMNRARHTVAKVKGDERIDGAIGAR